MLMTRITLRNVKRRGPPVPWPSLFARKASYSARRSGRCNRSSRIQGPGVLDAVAQRKIPGSFLPGILLESCQTFEIRSYAEREYSS
ncbi:hypothetical protein V1294_005017 [Bradyrhizobium sp. AZCC 1678]